MRRAITIVTPDNLRVELALAGVGSRGLAILVDHLVQLFAITVLVILLGLAAIPLGLFAPISELPYSILGAVFFLAQFMVSWGYFVFFEVWKQGQTPGKRWFGLRVLTVDGGPITFERSVLRNLVRVVDQLPVMYAVALVAAVTSRTNRRLGDLVADTIVVQEATDHRRRRVRSPAGAEHSTLSRRRDVVVKLSRALQGPQRRTLRELISRSEELSAERRMELYARARQGLEQLVPLDAPPFMSDEKVVLELVEAMEELVPAWDEVAELDPVAADPRASLRSPGARPADQADGSPTG